MLMIACIVFFLSGFSALLFEAAWFHLTGIVFGNSVAATAVVLASFMGGLALGNFLVVQKKTPLRNPAKTYALLELIIGSSGLILVFILPYLQNILAPLFQPLLTQPLLLNMLRSLCVFLLLLIPTTAMGATLPVLISLFDGGQERFTRWLGLLYGFNTFGATVGVLAGEIILMPAMGIRLSAVFACTANLIAASAAWVLLRRSGTVAAPTDARPAAPLPTQIVLQKNALILTAAFLTGFILIALEVIWFRFLLLFFTPLGLNFAIMLAIVLIGISIGGLIASRSSRRAFSADTVVAVMLNAAVLVTTYYHFDTILNLFRHSTEYACLTAGALFLMLPVSIISGITYTLLGGEIYRRTPSETRASGWLTIANTLGGTIGSLCAGIMFLPVLGMELSFSLLAIGYITVGLLLWKALPLPDGKNQDRIIITAVAVCALAVFPYGRMQDVYAKISYRPLEKLGEKRIAWHEGVMETIQYLVQPLIDKPRSYRLLTNNHSMSATAVRAQRYMRLYAYLPQALNPRMKNALLICFGCGNTAAALTEMKSLEHIDVVDISPDVIKTSEIIYADGPANPLHDPRLRLHIEDGRFFLLATDKTYDLITAEPPPLRGSKVANLYSQEYFRLIYNRLAPGGMVTYWLPVYQVDETAAKAIIQAFLNVFEHASLWSGSGYEWMLVGIKSPLPQPASEEFKHPWNDPAVSRHLRAVGLSTPELMTSLFIADRQDLREWVGATPPLCDDFPHRLACPGYAYKKVMPAYRQFSRVERRIKNFSNSPLIQKIIPEDIRAATRAFFELQPTITDIIDHPRKSIEMLNRCIQDPRLSPYILWTLDSDRYTQELLDEAWEKYGNVLLQNDTYLTHRIAQAIAAGEYARAEQLIDTRSLIVPAHQKQKYFPLKSYLHYLAGDADRLLRSFQNRYDKKTASEAGN
ncbi:MAG: fused MFS/spermidine synthase [Candidatus Omnitrophica bacterium]|nr:fused MFS/spermidine synthase [Candidatus Omnitrophota bacterium]